ncbi:TIGR04282 family arsenosugar biosynthesis glycosyltransferase [Pleomorphovibrio marinus]|uniref:TIGR04282 family arsenosugar biosynthesis glycosyltransferase n=1 Tax=Pleomorphovibrio marinus TaxID=2164132 RepID=UPI000E0BD415|nr:TIGR04282 family arsenosugar biosynthesis glycosyltransferase [Pleomorphovibrio marinus]
MENAVIVFEKEPLPGKVKTRLAKDIGEKEAAKVYKQLIVLTHNALNDVQADIFVFLDGDGMLKVRRDSRYHHTTQWGNNLGERMVHAFREVFKKGYKKALIIGTDCPEISKEILEDAFFQLDNHDITIGPALDGGYYLIGMNKLYASIFQSIPWSTEKVYDRTLEEIQGIGLSFSVLPTLRDIDDWEDLMAFKNKFNFG